MSLKAFVVTNDIQVVEAKSDLLGDTISDLIPCPMELGELWQEMQSVIKQNIKKPTKFTLEVSGSAEITGGVDAGVKVLVFHVGTKVEGKETNAMKITLETEINPD